jgi:hypothetical protein
MNLFNFVARAYGARSQIIPIAEKAQPVFQAHDDPAPFVEGGARPSVRSSTRTRGQGLYGRNKRAADRDEECRQAC